MNTKDPYERRVRRILKSDEEVFKLKQEILNEVKRIFLAYCLAKLRGTKYSLMQYEKNFINQAYELTFDVSVEEEDAKLP